MNLHFGLPIKCIDPHKELQIELVEETLRVAEEERSNATNPWAGRIDSSFKHNEYVNTVSDKCPLLEKWIYKQVNEYLNDLQLEQPYSFTKMDESWFNWSGKGMYQEFHIHPESDISGTFYVQTPPNCGNIIFNPPASAYNYHKLTHRSTVLEKSLHFEPMPARMILFPSYLEHMVQDNKNTEERISVAFNIKLID
mgnify:CR=1 FL=1|jgi:uncharacterized protein (TIGR02466 family)